VSLRRRDRPDRYWAISAMKAATLTAGCLNTKIHRADIVGMKLGSRDD
jgi:hypothetical protein